MGGCRNGGNSFVLEVAGGQEWEIMSWDLNEEGRIVASGLGVEAVGLHFRKTELC